ncbi:MAG: RiPP maturation radical SAM C-methyltransferase, partial [Actinobacteria bacterium]|nr:RiPP maturation radical SAM C-methyltransferase [Actinomycetota bacterium]
AQCRFCGLHEIMQYRTGEWTHVVEELEELEARYELNRFFAVDLIMPRHFYSTFLPELRRRAHKWSVFYEVKANVGETDVAALASAGVDWVQPGLESLDDRVLRLMRKGVTAVQNLYFLRLCEEHDIRVTWNIITGIPGEQAEWYEELEPRVRFLFHLQPPSGASEFQLHRFSPYFEQPAEFGIRSLGADPLYRAVFPVAEVDDLAYRHACEVPRTRPVKEYTQGLRQTVQHWQEARARGASLTLRCDGSEAVITDTRESDDPVIHRLSARELNLYQRLHAVQREDNLLTSEAPTSDDNRWVRRTLDHWSERGLVWRSGSRIVALAVDAVRAAAARDATAGTLPSPMPYLDTPGSPVRLLASAPS